jgi:predicted Zn-dependent protease
MKKVLIWLTAIAVIPFYSSCGGNKGVLLFSIQNDIDLGKQVRDEILANPREYPILPEAQYPQAYAYLRGITNKILNSGEITYKDQFAWEVRIINQDVLNAFAAPGGYIFVYTGLIKYLDREDDLAGVMGHEIAHADQRHSSRQLQQQYGISFLLSLLLGENPNKLKEIASQMAGKLAGLSFSRSHETEADKFSVIYLSKTPYVCNGAASFFQKMVDSGQSPGVPEFLSTHPDSQKRIDEINKQAQDRKCNTTNPIGGDGYAKFKAMLP